jgi:V-type H+-transporting ATPase proteolipid subunit
MGAAYGTSKAGVGIMVSGISAPDLVYKHLIPIIMAGVNGM